MLQKFELEIKSIVITICLIDEIKYKEFTKFFPQNRSTSGISGNLCGATVNKLRNDYKQTSISIAIVERFVYDLKRRETPLQPN